MIFRRLQGQWVKLGSVSSSGPTMQDLNAACQCLTDTSVALKFDRYLTVEKGIEAHSGLPRLAIDGGV